MRLKIACFTMPCVGRIPLGAFSLRPRASPPATRSFDKLVKLRFAAAPDGAGGIGRDHVQAISVHLYTYNNDPNLRIEELRSYERLFDQCGYAKDLPRYVTEVGAWYPEQFTEATPPMADKVRDIKRWCMIPAALRHRGVYLYKHSNLVTLGDPAHVPEIAAAIGEMRNGLRGKTLRRAALLDDDTIWLSFSDGSELRA